MYKCIPLAEITKNPTAYRNLMNAFSMANFTGDVQAKHEHFFAAFGKFFPLIVKHSGPILAEVKVI